MGQGVTFYCETCKKQYSLGYGSYSTWLYSKTIEEFLSEDPEKRNLTRNQNLFKCLKEHKGHDYQVHGDDNVGTNKNGDLCGEGYFGISETVFIKGVSSFEYIDMNSDT